MARIDVTVRGAGVFGLACAWEMTRRGARVLVVDPFGVGAGASGGVVGALAPHTPEQWNETKAFQFDSLIAAGRFWNGVETASGLTTGYGRTGRLQPIADDAGLERARARSIEASRLWQGEAVWEVIRDGADWAPRSATGWLIRDTLTARLHPAQACMALAEAIRRQGGRIAAEADDQGAVLWATGAAGLADLSVALGRSVGGPVKGQAAVLGLDRRDLPQLFADGVHVVPHADGTTAIGSTSERDFHEPTTTDGLLDQVIARARELCPALGDAPVWSRWAGLRPRARSRSPMLGAWPQRPGHFIANGGFKIGFGIAPGVARLMADLVLDGQDRIPDRFRVSASL